MSNKIGLDRNLNRNGAARQQDTTEFLVPQGAVRLTLTGFLRSLESNPRLLASVAKTPRNLSLAEATLRRWREAGYPHPGDWPDSEYRHVVSYTKFFLINGPFSKNAPSLASIRNMRPIFSPQIRREVVRLFWEIPPKPVAKKLPHPMAKNLAGQIRRRRQAECPPTD
jgi:hypothetical protein